jgi:hypothetical protein
VGLTILIHLNEKNMVKTLLGKSNTFLKHLSYGAALSHEFANDYGDYGFHITLPLSYAALNIASWALRPKSRKL